MKLALALIPTVLLMVFGQLVTKWRVQSLAAVDPAAGGMARLMTYLTDPYIVAAYFTTFLASVAWMFVVERYAVSAAYPLYIGLTVVLVALGGVALFGEPLSGWRVLSIVLIVAGVAAGVRA